MTPLQLTATMSIAFLASQLNFSSFAALLPFFTEEWMLTSAEAGWIGGIFFVGYVISVPIFGPLSDRVAPKLLWLSGAVLSALSSLSFAYFADGFFSAVALRFLSGLAFGAMFTPGLKILSDALTGKAQTRAAAFYTATFGLATGLSIFVSGAIFENLGWQAVFITGAVGSVIALVIVAFFVSQPPLPRDMPSTALLNFGPVLRSKNAMAYVVAYAAHNWEGFGVFTWGVAYLTFLSSYKGLAGFGGFSQADIAAIGALLAMPIAILGNEVANHFGRRRTLIIIMSMSAVFAVIVGGAADLPVWLILTLFGVYAGLIGADAGAITAGMVQNAPKGHEGATMAVHTLAGFAAGGLSPIAFGIALDMAGPTTITGWHAGFALLAIGLLLGPAALWRLSRE